MAKIKWHSEFVFDLSGGDKYKLVEIENYLCDDICDLCDLKFEGGFVHPPEHDCHLDEDKFSGVTCFSGNSFYYIEKIYKCDCSADAVWIYAPHDSNDKNPFTVMIVFLEDVLVSWNRKMVMMITPILQIGKWQLTEKEENCRALNFFI